MIRFYKNRKLYFLISAAFFLIAIVFAFVNGVQVAIDFKGGSIVKYAYNGGEVNVNGVVGTVIRVLGDDALPDVQLTENTLQGGADPYKIVISMGRELSAEQMENLNVAMTEDFPDLEPRWSESSSVEPFIGERFIRNSLIAIALGFLMIILYVWYAFRKIGGLSAGLMAIVALVHDVAIVLSVFIVFSIPIDESFVVAALTIIGFSVNDTIVVYDRIRENKAIYGDKLPIEDLVDQSINQSLTRSLNTSLAVFVSILVIFIFTELYGVSSMRSFTLPMLFGTVSGCYSTICLAGPLWVMWKKHKAKKTAVTAR